MVDKQWEKVNREKELKKTEDEKFISGRYPGLTLLPDGLRYKILIAGNGNKPSDGCEIVAKLPGTAD